MENSIEKERRKSERFPLLVEIRAQENRNLSIFSLQSRDLSFEGLGIFSPPSLVKESDHLYISFSLPGDIVPLRTKGKIMWIRKEKNLNNFEAKGGICFKEINALDRAKIINFIHKEFGSLKKIPLFSSQEKTLCKFKKDLASYLYQLKKDLIILENDFSPYKLDYFGVDLKGRAVLIFIKEEVNIEFLITILNVLGWFKDNLEIIKNYYKKINPNINPLLLMFALKFSPAFLRNIRYLKPLTIELFEAKILVSSTQRAIFVKKVVKEKEVISPFAEQDDLGWEAIYGLDSQRKRIVDWLSKRQ